MIKKLSPAMQKRYDFMRKLSDQLNTIGISAKYLERFNIIEIIDSDFNNRKILVSIVNLSILRITITFAKFPYTKDIESKRNAVKTAKDIFDFHNDLVTNNVEGLAQPLHNVKFKSLGLLYTNRYNEKHVEVFAHFPISATVFSFNAPEILREQTLRLNAFTQLIAIDYENPNSRWDKEIAIGKEWWKH